MGGERENAKIQKEESFGKNFKKVCIICVILSVLSMIASEIVLTKYNQKLYYGCRVVYLGMVMLWPIAYYKIGCYFKELMGSDEIKNAYKSTEIKRLDDLMEKYVSDLKLGNWFARILYLSVVMGIVGIVLYLGLPFDDKYVNRITLCGVVVIALITSYSVVLLVSILKTMYILVVDCEDCEAYSFEFESKSNLKLKKFNLNVGLFLSVIFITLQIGTFVSPYGFENLIVMAMFLIAIIPLLYFAFSIFLSKRLILTSKEKLIYTYNSEVLKEQYDKVIIDPTEENIDKFKRLLEFRDYIYSYNPANKKRLNELEPLLMVIGAVVPILLQIWLILIGG